LTLRLQIFRDNRNGWSVHGLSPQPAREFPSLSASIDFAREQCGAAPATIEVIANGCCAIVHQAEGWPRQLVGAEPKRSRCKGGDPGRSPRERRGRGARRALERWRSWLIGG
jgi:hypothetical protein